MPHIPRLTRLATILESFPEARFDIAVFHHQGRVCACGAAGLDPELQAEGYTLREAFPRIPQFGPYFCWDAVKEFFEIGDETCTWLFTTGFGESSPITPRVVAARIWKLINEQA